MMGRTLLPFVFTNQILHGEAMHLAGIQVLLLFTLHIPV
jgi:hypothetical protein